MPLKNYLKEYRAHIGVNQQELGQMVGTSRQTVSQIERGDYSPSVTLALKLLLHRVGDYKAKLPDFTHGESSHYRNFILAVKGETKTTSPFSITGKISQLFALGCIAQRVNRSIVFDKAKGEIVGDEYANYFIKGPKPRKGWECYYKV